MHQPPFAAAKPQRLAVLLLAALLLASPVMPRAHADGEGAGAGERGIPAPSPKTVAWTWPEAGFGGPPADTLVDGAGPYVYYTWSPNCDYPARHKIPMIYGAYDFYEAPAALNALFNGPCNDGRPLLFLNEPAMPEQANITPGQASDMFYQMTRDKAWPRARWKGQIIAGNNLIGQQQWDADFVQAFATKYNRGNKRIAEIAGWGVHLYGNFEYTPEIYFWNNEVSLTEVPGMVDASMARVDQYLKARRAERNATVLVATEFGYLHDRTIESWKEPSYDTTVAFMTEYVRRFRALRQFQSWLWFFSTDPESVRFDRDFLVDQDGALTPNGMKWQELAAEQGELR